MQDDLIFIFNVGVGLVPTLSAFRGQPQGLVPTLSAFRGQPQGIAPTISSQSHATPEQKGVNSLFLVSKV